jgi:N-carbamoyl-L-amino-acid hydrolase
MRTFTASFALVSLLIFSALTAARELPFASAERMQLRITKLSTYGPNPAGGVSRLAFSESDIEARKYIATLMAEAGLSVRIDTAGNLIGSRGGQQSLAPIMFGSHIDSVPGGGNYDGDVGVIGALEVAQLLHDNQISTRHPLQVVVFSDEEGGLTGSRAMVGKLGASALQVKSHSGLTIAEGLRAIGGDPDRLHEVQRNPGELTAFLELHIEQGGILDQESIEIGVVTGIVGISWWDIVITGVANHAGTTPMNARHDAMLSAAELVLAINEIITSAPGPQVGTVGRINAEPGAPNVIPGKVTMSLEIRDLSADTIWNMFQRIEARAALIAGQHGTNITFQHVPVDAEPAPTDERLQHIISHSAESLGLSSKYMPSGAGHDAQDMAQIAPTGMIFVPSAGGISHSPDEYTSPEDMANGANVLLHTVLAVDEQLE